MAKMLNVPRILAKVPDKGDYVNERTIHYKLASGDSNIDIWSKNVPFKFRVVDGYCVQHGDGTTADKVKLQRGDGAASESFTDITDDLVVGASSSDKDITRFTTLDDAQWEIAVNESLRIVSTSGALVDVYIKISPDLT